MVEPSKAPRVVCLCGSMRFHNEMHDIAVHESLCGRIVLMPHVNLRRGDVQVWCDDTEQATAWVKAALDRLHKQKIDLADTVIVVTDTAGYIGESTRSEIAYARSQGKPVQYWRWQITTTGGDAS